jgi:hypothetical protein
MMNEVVLNASDGLRLRIWLSEDRRLHHQIQFPFANRRFLGRPCLWASRTAPVFQYMDNLKTHSDGVQTALLLGKLESVHWSAAIEADPVRETITFDVACRFSKEPISLGSSYSLVASPNRSRPRLPIIEIAKIDDGVQRTLEIGKRYGEVSIRVFPGRAPLPRTVRWKYVVSFPVGQAFQPD